MYRYRLITALLAAGSLLICLNLSAQEMPKAAIVSQANGIDADTHIDLQISAEEAKNHLNELVTVCGLIVDTYVKHSFPSSFPYKNNHFLAGGSRNTYLYFDKPRGEHDFTVILTESVSGFMPKKLDTLEGHRACVFGIVGRYRQGVATRVIRSEQLATRELAKNQ